MSEMIAKLNIDWGTWECVFVITIERILESELLLVGDRKLDWIILKTIDDNIKLNEIAKGFLDEQDAIELRQRVLSHFEGV